VAYKQQEFASHSSGDWVLVSSLLWVADFLYVHMTERASAVWDFFSSKPGEFIEIEKCKVGELSPQCWGGSKEWSFFLIVLMPLHHTCDLFISQRL
jgi:hypothetical protein